MQQNEHVIKLLSDLVAIDSQSFKGNIQIIDYLIKLFKGYEVQEQSWVRDMDNVQGKNLIVKIAGKSNTHSLVFICHMDTVPTSDKWDTDPFILEEKEGNLYGLGACDTKGGIAALIEAAFTLTYKPLYDTYLIFDGDEECVFTGLRKYKKHLDLQNPIFICIEPTDSNLCIAARGLLSFEVQTHGKSQHASSATPENNRKFNAIHKMNQIMSALITDAEELASEHDAILGSNTQNLGVISGGSADNVIPEFCKLLVDRRLLPSKDTKMEIERIKKIIGKIDPSAEMINIFGQNGFSTSSMQNVTTQVLGLLKQFYPQAKPTHFQAMSEGAVLQDKGSVLVLGPGSIKQAHVANEFINAQELFRFVHIYQRIMQEVTF